MCLRIVEVREDEPAVQSSQLTAMLLPDYSSGSGVADIHVDKVSLYTPTGSRLLDDASIKLTYRGGATETPDTPSKTLYTHH